jgi:hypothetical protein
MRDRNEPDSTTAAADAGAPLSRRQALAAGVLVAAADLASAQGAAAAGDGPDGSVALGKGPANAVEFRARFVQTGASGQDFTAFGYLTRVAGLSDGDLFAGTAQNETTALMTAYASGSLTKRTLDQSVHSLDVEGALTVYARDAAGASWASPDSFRQGTAVAVFELSLQDILSVILPAQGIPTLTGSMRQTVAGKLGSSPGRRFGRPASQARLFATGVGRLVDPVTLNAALEMAGNWVVG